MNTEIKTDISGFCFFLAMVLVVLAVVAAMIRMHWPTADDLDLPETFEAHEPVLDFSMEDD